MESWPGHKLTHLELLNLILHPHKTVREMKGRMRNGLMAFTIIFARCFVFIQYKKRYESMYWWLGMNQMFGNHNYSAENSGYFKILPHCRHVCCIYKACCYFVIVTSKMLMFCQIIFYSREHWKCFICFFQPNSFCYRTFGAYLVQMGKCHENTSKTHSHLKSKRLCFKK